jgi:hypothetical protein
MKKTLRQLKSAEEEMSASAEGPFFGYAQIDQENASGVHRRFRLVAGIKRNHELLSSSHLEQSDETFRAVVFEGGTRRKPQAKMIVLPEGNDFGEAEFIIRPSKAAQYALEVDIFWKRNLVLRLPVSVSV